MNIRKILPQMLLLCILPLSCLAADLNEQREKIKEKWVQEMIPFIKSHEFVPRKTEILYQLVSTAPTEFYRFEYKRVTTQYVDWLPSAHTGKDYDYTLLQGIILSLINGKKFDELRNVLKVNCPQYINNLPLEYLIVREFGPKAFQVFIDGYDNAKYEQTRNQHGEIVSRSFVSVAGITRPLPDRVRVAKAQYKEGRNRFVLNPNYVHNILHEYRDLFVDRGSGQSK